MQYKIFNDELKPNYLLEPILLPSKEERTNIITKNVESSTIKQTIYEKAMQRWMYGNDGYIMPPFKSVSSNLEKRAKLHGKLE